MEVLQLINDKLPTLSQNQQKVAEYILSNWEKVCYESAITIADTLGVSQSTVIRTATVLGFDGFPSLQNELRQLVTSRVSIINLLDKSQTITTGQGIEEILKQAFQKHAENLDATLRQLDPQKVEQAALAMGNCRKLYVIGMRSSASAADYLGFNASMIRPDVVILDGDYNLVERLTDLSKEDVVVGVSFSRYTKLVVETLRWARKTGATLIGITDATTSPIVGLVNIPFITSTLSTHFNHSHIGAIAVMDALLTAMMSSDRVKATKKLQAVERNLKQMDIFA